MVVRWVEFGILAESKMTNPRLLLSDLGHDKFCIQREALLTSHFRCVPLTTRTQIKTDRQTS
jgi:hypothetical protein